MEHISKPQIYDLLYRALLDLRAEGYASQNQLVFLLADLFHNIPLQLDRVDQGELTPDDVIVWLRRRAQGTLMENWLTLRLSEAMAKNADRPVQHDITPDVNDPR